MNRRPAQTGEAAGVLGGMTIIPSPTDDSATLDGLELSRVAFDDYAEHRDPERAVRWSDPDTSRNATRITPERLSRLMQTILDLLAARPSTDDELADAYLDCWEHDPETYPRRSRQRIGTARHELAELGHVRDSGERRAYRHHLPAIVWERVTPWGADS